MLAEPVYPIQSLRGTLIKGGYYFRLYRGRQIVQRCPTGWKDTPARKAARERFTFLSRPKGSNDYYALSCKQQSFVEKTAFMRA